jgi:glycosyltransferase involved in cell wall biosynthesis
MNNRQMCFVTEVDLDRESAGAIVDDKKFVSCLKELGRVDTIYLQKRKYRSMWSALAYFTLEISKSFSKPHQIYFSRGLVTSFALLSFKRIFRAQKKIVHKTPIPFPSNEARYLRYSKVEFFVRYCTFRFLEKIIMSKVDAIMVPTLNYATELVKNGVEESRVFVIPYYIEDDFFEQPIKRREDETFTFSYIGGFHAYHDLAPLIEAFALLSGSNKAINLVLVGEGVLRPEIEKLVHERRLENKIIFRGRMSHRSVPSFLSEIDAFVYMARTAGMSTSLLEAAAAGKPIITLRKKNDSSLARHFRHEKEIYMVNNLSPVEVAKALELLHANSSLRISLSEGARKVALENFSKKATLRELDKLVKTI